MFIIFFAQGKVQSLLMLLYNRKYERCKTAIKTYKINEDLLKQTVGTYEENLNKQFERYEQLKQYTMSQLDKYFYLQFSLTIYCTKVAIERLKV